MGTDYYALSHEHALIVLKSSLKGLTYEEAKKRLKEHGPNALKEENRATAIMLFFSQFKNALVLLLIFAGALSLFMGDTAEAIAILIIVLLNTILGFVQEYQAEKAIRALEEISAPTARVVRDGIESRIPAKEIVPGDIIVLESGDIVAADSRILDHSNLEIDESSLTGESVPSQKVSRVLKDDISVADQVNMAFMSTIVTYGKAKCVVTATGMNTEIGKIASSIESTKERETPLQIKFTELARDIGVVALFLIFFVFFFGIMQGALSFTEMLLFAMVLTVSTVPNALPMIVTVSLSLGSRRLAKNNMLIKKLPAAESLGSATIICSDKTGTITKNQMTVTHIFVDNKTITVTGTGYEPKGEFSSNGKKVNPDELELISRIGVLCNNAELVGKKNRFEIVGDPTEGAIIVAGKKAGFDKAGMKKDFIFVEELPFDSERKMMSVIFRNRNNRKTEAYVKGAPDLLLKQCSKISINGRVRKLSAPEKDDIIEKNESFAENALRVIGFAYKDVSDLKKFTRESVENDLIFVGLAGMIDPPRDGVKDAIKKCNKAGIDVMIITGDHAITTKAIAQRIGLFNEGDIVLVGDDLEKMSDAQLQAKIDNVRIIARALPIQKLRIVDILQKRGHIVAMTGDGVNDAPALKKADIGIAMGISGTDVAKEVSRAILVDDNFVTIVNAIEEGRNIYDKIVKSAKYLLACNSGEIMTVFLSILGGLPLPLLPLQLLLINILTDQLPALGLGTETSEKGIMDRPPRNPKDRPITGRLFLSIALFGIIMGAGTLILFAQYKDTDLPKAQTVAFTTLVMFQMFAVMSSRSIYPSLEKLNPFSNKWLLSGVILAVLIQIIVVYWAPMQSIFGTVPLMWLDWAKIIGMSLIGLIGMELSKFFVDGRQRHVHPVAKDS